MTLPQFYNPTRCLPESKDTSILTVAECNGHLALAALAWRRKVRRGVPIVETKRSVAACIAILLPANAAAAPKQKPARKIRPYETETRRDNLNAPFESPLGRESTARTLTNAGDVGAACKPPDLVDLRKRKAASRAW